MQAYRFTHFTGNESVQTDRPENLSTAQKTWVLLTGTRCPKPTNPGMPNCAFQTIKFPGRDSLTLECWKIASEQKRGTVILFHGHCASKSQLLNEGAEFVRQGYDVLLVDFSGHGGSQGHTTTMGYREAEDVISAYTYVRMENPTKPVVLYGISMGATAVMRAVSQGEIHPDGIILECPFGSLLKTVRNRFSLMHLPASPLAELLLFWGSVQNGFWAFNHNPITYARQITVPVLLMSGSDDIRADPEEIHRIHANLPGPKTLKMFPGIGHASLYRASRDLWIRTVSGFLDDI